MSSASTSSRDNVKLKDVKIHQILKSQETKQTQLKALEFSKCPWDNLNLMCYFNNYKIFKNIF